MLAYIKQFGFGRQFEILIENGAQVPHKLEQIAQKLGAVFVAPEEIYSQTYEELFIHSYFKFELQIPYISRIQFKSLTYYSDGLRNGFYGLPTLDTRLHKLIYFGFKLSEESFESSMPQSLKEIENETVVFNTMEDIWHEIHEPRIGGIPFIFQQTDLLLVMRYWGMPGPSYQFVKNYNILDYLREEISEIPNFNRMIYRSHPWFDHQLDKEKLQNLVNGNVEVIMWNDIFETDQTFPEADEPESLIYRSVDSPGLFFGFDSSLNILVSEKWPLTKIVWPDHNKFSKYFDLTRSTNLVSEQIQMMKQYNSRQIKDGVIELNVGGHEISSVISSMALQPESKIQILELASERDALTRERDALTRERDALTQERDALTQERDALTQERDALTQERDALTQERDALTQERDALTSSTIWRSTFLLRSVITNLRKFR